MRYGYADQSHLTRDFVRFAGNTRRGDNVTAERSRCADVARGPELGRQRATMENIASLRELVELEAAHLVDQLLAVLRPDGSER